MGTSTEPDLRLTVPAQAENVAVVRQAIAGFGEAIGLDEPAIDDLKTLVTEACMNAVMHAYDAVPGPVEVTARRNSRNLEVVVRDRGVGFRPRPAEPERTTLRLGLPMIAALSDGFEIRGGPGEGTEVRIRKRLEGSEEPAEPAPAPHATGTAVAFTPGAPVRPVLGRVIGTLAARADLSIDRLSDTMLLGDAVATRAVSELATGGLEILLSDSDGHLELRIGPFPAGSGDHVLKSMDLPGSLGSLRSLASSVEIEPNGGTEHLVIAIDDPRGAGA